MSAVAFNTAHIVAIVALSAAALLLNQRGTGGVVPSFIDPPLKLGKEFATTSTVLTYRGKAEPGALISVRSKDVEINKNLANEEGIFEGSVSLTPGTYEITLVQLDARDRVVQKSEPYRLRVKDLLSTLTTPLTILSHESDSQVLAGATPVAGVARPEQRIRLTIDGRQFQTTTKSDGTWQFNVSLQRGRRTLVIETLTTPSERASLVLDVR